MTTSTSALVEATRTAATAMTPWERAELVEQLVRAVHDEVKFHVPGGADGEERIGLASVLDAAVANLDEHRAARVRPRTPEQQLIDALVDRGCNESPNIDWVITLPEEVGLRLPLDGVWLSRPGAGGVPGGFQTLVYRGYELTAIPMTKPAAILSDARGAAPSVYLNLDTGQIGHDMVEIGLVQPGAAGGDAAS